MSQPEGIDPWQRTLRSLDLAARRLNLSSASLDVYRQRLLQGVMVLGLGGPVEEFVGQLDRTPTDATLVQFITDLLQADPCNLVWMVERVPSGISRSPALLPKVLAAAVYIDNHSSWALDSSYRDGLSRILRTTAFIDIVQSTAADLLRSGEHKARNYIDPSYRRLPIDPPVTSSPGDIGEPDDLEAVQAAVFPVTVNYNAPIDEMLAAGKYDFDGMSSTYEFDLRVWCPAPQRQGEASIRLRLVPTSKLPRAPNLRDADHAELLAFGARYPQVQRHWEVIAAGSAWGKPELRNMCLYLGYHYNDAHPGRYVALTVGPPFGRAIHAERTKSLYAVVEAGA